MGKFRGQTFFQESNKYSFFEKQISKPTANNWWLESLLAQCTMMPFEGFAFGVVVLLLLLFHFNQLNSRGNRTAITTLKESQLQKESGGRKGTTIFVRTNLCTRGTFQERGSAKQ